jgi:hypothetical protein
MISIEEMKIKRFVRCLICSLFKAIRVHEFRTFITIMDHAWVIEAYENEDKESDIMAKG